MSLTKMLNTARHMPALFHKLPGEEYDQGRSEVINWLVAQPETRVFIFERVHEARAIEFDGATGIWKGAGDGVYYEVKKKRCRRYDVKPQDLPDLP